MAQKRFGGQCGECTSCGKCDQLLSRQSQSVETAIRSSVQTETQHTNEQTPTMEQDNSIKLYTFLIYSEHVPGMLSQISSLFTRRQVNIETLNVCASSTPGVHKYTITAYCDEHVAQMLTVQSERRIEVLQANYYSDDEIFINETALYKVCSSVLVNNSDVSRMVRLYDGRIIEVNTTYAVIEKTGLTKDILSLYEELNKFDCVLQFVRSGRICITKSRTEHLDEYLAAREAARALKTIK